MNREEAIEGFLGHVSGEYLRRLAEGARSDREAADRLKAHASACGMHDGDGWWTVLAGDGRGVAYGDRGTTWDEPDGVVTWLEIARSARGAAEQLTMGL